MEELSIDGLMERIILLSEEQSAYERGSYQYDVCDAELQYLSSLLHRKQNDK